MTEANPKAAALCRKIAIFGGILIIAFAFLLSYGLRGAIIWPAIIAAIIAAFFHVLAFWFLAKQFEVSDSDPS